MTLSASLCRDNSATRDVRVIFASGSTEALVAVLAQHRHGMPAAHRYPDMLARQAVNAAIVRAELTRRAVALSASPIAKAAAAA